MESYIPPFQKGDAVAFEVFFKAYYKPLTFFAFKLIEDTLEAEDIVKEAYVKLWEKHSDFGHPGSIKSFLYTTTRNACMNHIKHIKIREVHRKNVLEGNKSEYDDIITDQMVHAELIHSILKEVDKLPERRRMVFNMFYREGMKLEEISNKLGISVFTVKEHKAKALAQLRLRFSDRQLLLVLFLLGQSRN